MEERILTWRGRPIRVQVMDVPANYDQLLRRVSDEAKKTTELDQLGDIVSAVFDAYVRVSRPAEEGEEIVIRVG